MRPLDRNLRNQLEAAINEAREIAEKAARAALEQLGVHEAAPYDFLDEDARDLRRRLRSHGRRLGDTLLDKRQTLDNLVEEQCEKFRQPVSLRIEKLGGYLGHGFKGFTLDIE